MPRKTQTSAIIDNILRIGVTGAALSAGLLLPNLFIALDKPLQKYLGTLDEHARQRELQRVIGYMKRQRLLTEDYTHGLQVTPKGKQRLSESEYDNLAVSAPTAWDKKWRIVFYDIPQPRRANRNSLVNKLHTIGFSQLQQSIWIFPFPCRQEIIAVTSHNEVSKYVSYIEASHIDHQANLISRFAKKFPQTDFK